jgi:hypothetical protein
MSESRLQFLGTGPFSLSPMQGARAEIQEGSIEIKLYTEANGRAALVLATLDRAAARTLSNDLVQALARLAKK